MGKDGTMSAHSDQNRYEDATHDQTEAPVPVS
jgi:hypothetical protein